MAIGRLPAGITCGGSPLRKRPSRGPVCSTATSATQPPTLCTTVEPAKSTKPSRASQPGSLRPQAPPQAQWPNTGYTSTDTSTEMPR